MKTLSRRAFIHGSAGFAIGLPLLEAMMSNRAWGAADVPKRYLLGFTGMAIGSGKGSINDTVVPNIVGANYDLKSAFTNLAPVKSLMTLVTGLKIPEVSNGSTPPPGGMTYPGGAWHEFQLPGLLTGMRSTVDHASMWRSPTTDNIAADLLGGNPLLKVLYTTVQPSGYYGAGAPGSITSVSYKRSGTGVVKVAPRYSPQQVFQTLFGNTASGNATAEQIAQQNWLITQRKSVLDSVITRMSSIKAKLGVADQRRLDTHLEEFRDLEKVVATVPVPVTTTCVKPADPGPDPAIGGKKVFDPVKKVYVYTQDSSYSGEEQRAKAMADLAHMALVCDLTRSVLFQFADDQSGMNMKPLTGQSTDLHGLSHNDLSNATLELAKGINWHMKHWAYLIGKLKASPEGTGSLLDNMATVFTFEAGHGIAPTNGKLGPHCVDNMVMLVAGGAGGLKQGVHIKATGMHPARVSLTALRALGYQDNTIGEISGEIPGLRG